MTVSSLISLKYSPNWEKHPFLLLAVFFILGIGTSSLLDFHLLSLVVSSCIYFSFLLWFERKRWVSVNLLFYKTLAVCIAIFLAGVLRYEIEKPKNRPDHILHFINYDYKNIQIKGTVIQIDKGGNSWKVYVKVIELCQNKCIALNTKTIVYLKGDLKISVLDAVTIRGKLLPKMTPNFKAFDYNNYLERNGIYFTMFVKSSDQNVEISKKSSLWSNPVIKIKNILLQNIEKNIDDNLIQSLCKAMFLGDRTEVDDETIMLFSHTGAIHILAVSGMHVGIIMGFIIWLTGLVKRNTRIWKVIKTVTIISITLLFIVITGATPSVQRAGLLFIILYLTKDNPDKLSSLNVLGIVAVVLLLYDPDQALTLSFQFSFTAVLSILLFNQWVSGWITSKNIWINKTWSFFAVSFSVQILMAPLIIYYFGFYTTWFFINNLAAIPMVYLGIFGSMVISGLSFISFQAATFFGKLISFLMGFLYDSLAVMNQLPLGLIDQISWTVTDLILVYSVIFFIYVYLKYKTTFHFKGLIYSLLLLTISISISALSNVYTKEVVFYSVNKGYMIDIFYGNMLYTLKNNHLDEASEKYSSSGYRRSKQNNQPIYVSMDANSEYRSLITKKNTFQFQDKIFIKLLPKDQRNLNLAHYVIIDKNIQSNDITLLKGFIGEVILLNEARQKTKEGILQFGRYKFKVTDISKTGSYRINLK